LVTYAKPGEEGKVVGGNWRLHFKVATLLCRNKTTIAKSKQVLQNVLRKVVSNDDDDNDDILHSTVGFHGSGKYVSSDIGHVQYKAVSLLVRDRLYLTPAKH
jgi:hypothetical protein